MTQAKLILWHLRIYGDCSAARLIETSGLPRVAVVSALWGLRHKGLADHVGPARYDITEEGRRELEGSTRGLFPPPG